MPSGHLLILGQGYTGKAVAQKALENGWRVTATSRAQAGRIIHPSGYALYPFDEAAGVESVTHVLSTIPPAESGDPALPVLKSVRPAWSGYLSTTGVYGDYQGEWVTEASELRGTSPRTLRRIEAENEWLSHDAAIFRLAGIYGPERNALEEVLAGSARRVVKQGQVFSRIHVDDIAGVVVSAMQGEARGVYNICDDEPAPSHTVVEYACELLGREPPPVIPFEQAQLSPMAREFYSANRRVSNTRMKDTLGYQLLYPSFREGLSALARDLQKQPML